MVKTTGLIALSLLCWVSSATAQEVYRWVDENGVVNYSDTAPSAEADLNKVNLEGAAPRNYDPEEDLYNVAAQAERMQALREQMEKDREARRQQQASAAKQPAPQYSRGVNYGYPYGYPVRPRPPIKPPIEPPRPVPEPYETSTLAPPSQWRGPDDR